MRSKPVATLTPARLDHLKGYLGRSWNTRWLGAGFSEGTLRLPRNPVSLLLELRAYLAVTRSARTAGQWRDCRPGEHTWRWLSLRRSWQKATRLTLANVATNARDESLERLRDRIVGLRNELEQLIEPDDMRWRTFGFCPADRSSHSEGGDRSRAACGRFAWRDHRRMAGGQRRGELPRRAPSPDV
jgi:hypothetical protein